VLAKTFDLPPETFADFPKKEVYIATGPVPPPLAEEPAPGSLDKPPLTHRYELLAQKPDQFAGGTMRTVSEAEFPISTTMTGALLIIQPGALRELHWHPNAAEWQFYLKGSDDLEIVLALNNATYQSVSITAWIAANPDLLLATNFGVPESVFAEFPKAALIMPK
jgi:oxalate decarboxylase